MNIGVGLWFFVLITLPVLFFLLSTFGAFCKDTFSTDTFKAYKIVTIKVLQALYDTPLLCLFLLLRMCLHKKMSTHLPE